MNLKPRPPEVIDSEVGAVLFRECVLLLLAGEEMVGAAIQQAILRARLQGMSRQGQRDILDTIDWQISPDSLKNVKATMDLIDELVGSDILDFS